MAGSQTSSVTRIKRLTLLSAAALALISAACQPGNPPPAAVPVMPAKASPSPAVTAEVLEPTSAPTVTSEAPPATETLAPLVFATGGSNYTLPPTVQFVDAHSAVVVFEVDTVEGMGLLVWEPDTDPRSGRWLPVPVGGGVHAVEIPDLKPATEYRAAVLSKPPESTAEVPAFMGEAWDPIHIQTLPETGLPVRIVVMGDSGFGQAVTQTMAQAMADQQPDIFIHTGDLVYNAHQEGSPAGAYQFKWFQTLAPLLRTAAVLPVVGNHEMYDDALWEGRSYYFHAFPVFDQYLDEGGGQPEAGRRDYYRVALGDLQLLFLNTQELFGGQRRREQDDWLEARLGDESFSASIVVFHVPPYTSGRHKLDGTAVIRSWVPLFETYGVPLVLSGHDHNYEHLFQNGVNYVVSGGGSSVLYEQGIPLPISMQFSQRSHYLVIDLLPGLLRLTAYASDGAQLDTFEVTLN